MANLFTPRPHTDSVNGSRFGSDGIFHPPKPSTNGDFQTAHSSPRTGGLARFWDRLSFTNPFASKRPENGGDDEGGNGVHAITKKTDYWFNRELYQIARAREDAGPDPDGERSCYRVSTRCPIVFIGR